MGLAGFENHYPNQLSGGMQQRVGLVRALAMNPSVLLMDEPFAALDAQTREILQEELLNIMGRLEERKTMVFITHSIDEALLLGDRIAVMSSRLGRIKEGAGGSVRPSARRQRAPRRSPLRRDAGAYLGRTAHRAAAIGPRTAGGRVSTLADRALFDDQAMAERVAAARRRRTALQNLCIRLVSLAIFLGLWQIGAMNTDPVLFTSPGKVAVAAVDMIGQRRVVGRARPELFCWCWWMGLTLAIVFGTLLGLALARFRVLDVGLSVYRIHLPLSSIPSVALVPLIVLWAGYADHRQGHHPLFLFAFFPDGDQHLPGREIGRSEAARSRPRVPLLWSGNSGPTSSCLGRCRSSLPAFAWLSAAA